MQALCTQWLLVAISTLNALYALTRTRQYRLFESNIDREPQTPSARRVKVQSTPVSASPIRFISNLVSTQSAESRAHPDSAKDVWELSVWDPLPITLQLLCIFSPGHVLVYMMNLPVSPLEERPSVTVVKCILLQAVMTVQMLVLTARYSRLIKDSAIIQKEVMHEYDTKFVHPRLHPVVRDVGTQVSMGTSAGVRDTVEVGTPTTLIKRGFQTHPNPNYLSHIDPDGSPMPRMKPLVPASSSTPNYTSSGTQAYSQTPNYRPTRQSISHNAATPSRPVATSSGINTNYGGSMGVYTHQKSPLKKATSVADMNDAVFSPRNSREMAALEQQTNMRRQLSPVKNAESRRVTSTNALQTKQQWGGERYPSRW